ncbi:SIMPL domain-containing protein [Niallia sp. Krafla_26]|uniref:SIMPL domain-containing protein n=1 Tax=Niallia sp. Krafla_26 TaxID=3064703 RepID=UPI003D16C6B9
MYYQQALPFHRTNQHARANTLTVTGEGIILVRPDQAKITLGIVTQNMDVQRAQKENASISNTVINALKELGIDASDIRTAQYTIYPRYDYVEGKSILRGYEVEHFLEVLVKNLDLIGSVYETAIRNGVNRSGSIQLMVSNQELFYQEALKRALQNALEKASVISQTIGVRLNRIPLKITEQSQPQERITRVLAAQSQSLQAQEVPPIQTGENTIQANVHVVYAYD